MKRYFVAAAIAAVGAQAAWAVTLGDIAAKLRAVACARATGQCEVLLPTAADPVVYNIALDYTQQPADTLAGCQYVIDWQLLRNDRKVSQGFSAYFDGNHYRYRDTRLQEYHMADSKSSFGAQGVQRTVQFGEYLPEFIAQQLQDMSTDTTYSVKVTQRGSEIEVSALQRVRGYDAKKLNYVFSADNGLPVKLSTDYMPGSISEQNVTATFQWQWLPAGQCMQLDEKALIARYPQEFEKYRASNFGVQSLPGNALPAFTARDAEGARYHYNRGEGWSQPMVIVFLDGDAQNTGHAVQQVRSAVAGIPFGVNVLYVTARGAALTEAAQDGEKMLGNASGLVRDCGVSMYPTLLFVSADGVVRQTQIGYNNNLSDIVIEKTMLTKALQ